MEYNIENKCVLRERINDDGCRYALVICAEIDKNEKSVLIRVREEFDENLIDCKYEQVLIRLNVEEFKKQHQFLLAWFLWSVKKGYSFKVI